ncbi:MAG: transposase [Opitutaceae bacterium]|nr:transposase [Opitutaceae bacterium]
MGIGKNERASKPRDSRGGCYVRRLKSQIGTLELRVPYDRGRLYSAKESARFRRREKVLLLAMPESSAETNHCSAWLASFSCWSRTQLSSLASVSSNDPASGRR